MEEMGVGIVWLLRAAWILATLPIVVALLPLPGIGWFRSVLLGFAKRGKVLRSNSRLTVPQRFFSHFYVVAVFWTTMLLVAVWFYAIKNLPSLIEQDFFSAITSHLTGGSHAFSSHKSISTREHVYNVWLSVFLLLLMEAQVVRRFYETIYVFNYSPSARMHILGYLAGMFFYTAAPLSLCCTFAPEVFDFVKSMVAEFIVKGKDRMSRPEFNIWMFVIPFLRLRWYAWLGVAIFLWGWIHQLRCHEILGSLRDKTEKLEEYVIPYGDWFEYVSSPHYLAEIVIYGGLLVASGGADLSLWLLLAFVVSNLVFAATETQRWYLHKFDNYPRNRYYIAAPLSLCCSFAPEVFKFVKNVANDFIVEGKNPMLSNQKFNIGILVTPLLMLRWYAWLGAAIFLWGWVHQRRCHAILGSLRKNPKEPTKYIIPYGDWFEYVSSPHYTAEIVMYGGLVVASGGADLTLWLLFAFVVANLGFASMTTHKWYLHKFDDYPPDRCAIFPFVY